MPVEKQVILIWTATNGYLDELPIEVLDKFEKEFCSLKLKINTRIYSKIFLFKKKINSGDSINFENCFRCLLLNLKKRTT
jgi:F0F1-type ATP synthase alpha subunit